MKTIRDNDLKERVLENRHPTLLYFYSPLQVPCLFAEAPLERQEKNFDGKVDFFKMDINEGVDTCHRYGVFSVPKMLLFKDGNLIAQRMGSTSSDVIESFITAHI